MSININISQTIFNKQTIIVDNINGESEMTFGSPKETNQNPRHAQWLATHHPRLCGDTTASSCEPTSWSWTVAGLATVNNGKAKTPNKQIEMRDPCHSSIYFLQLLT